MDFDPQVYDNSNNDTLIPAKRLIDIINDLNPENSKLSTIVDIGCGSGNMTKLISEEIECEKIIGCDIDQNMIEFAEKVNKRSNISYVLQDIEQNWKEFCPLFHSLRGKVSVVTSNFALTWIKDIKTAAQNISNLVGKDGILIANIVYDGDIYESLEPQQRLTAEQYLKYPTEEELIGKWVCGLKGSGFTQIDINYLKPKSIFTEKVYFEEYLNIPINWYKGYAKGLKNGQNIEITKLLKQLLIDDRCKRLDMKSSEGEDLIEVTNYIWQIVATKK